MRAKKLCLVFFFSASELGATPFPKPKRSCHRTSRFVSVPPTISVTGGHGDHEGSVKSTARFAEYFGRDTRSGSSPSPRPRGFFFFFLKKNFSRTHQHPIWDVRLWSSLASVRAVRVLISILEVCDWRGDTEANTAASRNRGLPGRDTRTGR